MVCTISFGLEMCIAVGNVYVLPLLMQRGMEKQHMTMVFGKWMNYTGLGGLLLTCNTLQLLVTCMLSVTPGSVTEMAKVHTSFTQVEVHILVFKNTLVKVEVLTKLLYSSKSKEGFEMYLSKKYP